MSKKIVAIMLMIIIVCTAFFAGCYRVTTYTVPNDVAVTQPVSLATDLIPIFSKSCSISGCHNSGGLKPDLTSANAYNSLINGNYTNVSTPANSLVYLWLTGKEAATMPIGSANNPANLNNLILAWINQGVKNN